MTGFAKVVFLLVVSMGLLASGCSTKTQNAHQVQAAPKVAVTCIGVLPVVTGINYDKTVSPEQAKALQSGVQVMDGLLQQELGGTKDIIHFVSASQVEGLQESVSTKPLDLARRLGGLSGCNVVLMTTVSRYVDRVGGKYTAKTPASVSFEFSLIETDNGMVLCRSKFDEVQEPALENIYKWSKARARAFSWVSAQELMTEGLQEKLSGCSYLQGQ